jgi:hypothetical protein
METLGCSPGHKRPETAHQAEEAGQRKPVLVTGLQPR